MEKLFFDKKEKECVVVTNKDLYCSKCKEELKGFFMLQRSYSKILPPTESFYCSTCGKHNIKRDLDFFSMVRIERTIKDSYNLISEYAPELRKGELDLFSACNLPSDKTEDKTVLAKYESWEGAQIGNKDYITEMPKDITLLQAMTSEDKMPYPEVQIDKFFLDIKKAKPILPKQLENKEWGR